MADKRFSIITKDFNSCLICGSYRNIHKHEIFFGRGKRELSIKYGLVVPLCLYHHTGSNIAVHGKDGDKLNKELKILGQKAFEWTHSREEFIKTFGKSYILD